MNRGVALALTLVATMSAACADSGETSGDSRPEVTLLTHDSFDVGANVVRAFEREHRIDLRIVPAGDAGQLVNRAILTAGNPEGDVLFGVDDNLFPAAIEAGVFEPYESPALARVDDALELDPTHAVTPIDRGDVCLNVDRGWFERRSLAPPDDIADLTDRAYRGLTVVQNPATSTPGLAFMLATIARLGEGWQDFWRALRANDVLVVDGWEQAYYGEFSGAGGGEGERPIVVSYATSPAAEVVFAEEELDEAPTAAVDRELLSTGGVRRCARGERPRRGGARGDRLHAVRALPGRRAAAHVRVPGRRRRGAATRVRALGGGAREPPQPARRARGRRAGGVGPHVDRPDVRLRLAAVGRLALVAVPAVFLAVFFVYPLGSIVGSVAEELSPGSVLGDERLRGVIWFTTWQAVVSTSLTLAAGLPAAFLLARFRFPGRSALRVASLVAFVLPTVVVGTAFGGRGPSLAALFAAHVFFNLAVVIRVVGGFWSQLDPAYEDVAAEMGATGARRFTDVLLPLARPAIVGAATLVFLFTFTSFGVALLLAGPSRATIEVEIFRQTSQLLDLPVAAVLTLVQLVIVSALLWITSATESRAGVRQRLVASADAARRPRTSGERAFVAAAAPLLACRVARAAAPARVAVGAHPGGDHARPVRGAR